MQGHFLRFYVHENQRHGRQLLWEWLLETARTAGIRGGSAFRAMAGFGRHHVLHEDHFFELAGSLVVEVEFIVAEDEEARLLDIVRGSGACVFYARIPAQFAVINAGKGDAPK